MVYVYSCLQISKVEMVEMQRERDMQITRDSIRTIAGDYKHKVEAMLGDPWRRVMIVFGPNCAQSVCDEILAVTSCYPHSHALVQRRSQDTDDGVALHVKEVNRLMSLHVTVGDRKASVVNLIKLAAIDVTAAKSIDTMTLQQGDREKILQRLPQDLIWPVSQYKTVRNHLIVVSAIVVGTFLLLSPYGLM
jgi:hypothetical protein